MPLDIDNIKVKANLKGPSAKPLPDEGEENAPEPQEMDTGVGDRMSQIIKGLQAQLRVDLHDRLNR
jgi:hypothetical protein